MATVAASRTFNSFGSFALFAWHGYRLSITRITQCLARP